jgi:hypothetical protein
LTWKAGNFVSLGNFFPLFFYEIVPPQEVSLVWWESFLIGYNLEGNILCRRGSPPLKKIFPVPQNVDESRSSCFSLPRLQLSQMRSLSVFFHVLTLGNAAWKPKYSIFWSKNVLPSPWAWYFCIFEAKPVHERTCGVIGKFTLRSKWIKQGYDYPKLTANLSSSSSQHLV